MSGAHGYRAVGWNRQKKVYDRIVSLGVLLTLASFAIVSLISRPEITIETALIRALGLTAFLLLHLILSIGPLARLDNRFLPLLYNRRHLGVTMFILALGHGVFSIVQFHTLGNVNPLVSVLTSNGRYDSLGQFPFQPLGLVALVALFLMAATSHDFWLAHLTPPVWKSLHMGVYFAYGLIVLHIALGVLQAERHPGLTLLLWAGMFWILGIHLAAGWRESARDREHRSEHRTADGYVELCRLADIPDQRAHVACVAGERLAVFRYDDRLSAISSVCQHQNGPLGEGRVIDGCITCPWHGYQYEPETGASPPPFNEKVPTFSLRLDGDRVLIDPRPNPPGTRVEAVPITSQGDPMEKSAP